MSRRNPQSANPRRRRGPPPPPTSAEMKSAMAAWVKRFRERRGCPAHVHPDYVAALRGKGAWWDGRYDVPRPDGGPSELP